LDVHDADALGKAAHRVKAESVQDKTGESESDQNDRREQDFEDRLHDKVDEREQTGGFGERPRIKGNLESRDQSVAQIKPQGVDEEHENQFSQFGHESK